MSFVRHAILRNEIYHFNLRMSGKIYRKSLKTDSPSTCRKYVSDIMAFINTAKLLRKELMKQDVDTFIETLIANKVNELVRLGKVVTEPLSDTAKTYFQQWFEENNSSLAENEILDQLGGEHGLKVSKLYKPVVDFKEWISNKLNLIGNYDPLYYELTEYDPETGGRRDNKEMVDKGLRISSHHFLRCAELDRIISQHADNMLMAFNRNRHNVFRVETEELNSKFKTLLPNEHVPVPVKEKSELKSPRYEDILDDLTDYMHRRNHESKTVSNKIGTYRELMPAFEGVYLEQITFEDIEDAWRILSNSPKLTHCKEYDIDGETKEERLAKRWEIISSGDIDVDQKHLLSSSTLKDKRAFLTDLFKWADRKGYIKDNPLEKAELDIKSHRKTSRKPIPKQYAYQIVNYFKDNLSDPYAWPILIMAYHGMRNKEVENLTKKQVITDPESGIVFFNIPKGKTLNAVRRIPIHSDIIHAGFMSYVDSKDSKLFNVTSGKMSNYYNNFIRKKFAVPKETLAGEMINLYSFRHNVITQLSTETSALKYRLFGHGNESITANYEDNNLHFEQKIINKIKYEN